MSQLAIPFISLTPDVDEMQRGSETATDYLNRVVTAKVNSMGQQLCSGRFSAVLGADTIIRLDERIIQKPQNSGEAIEILESLSGRAHQVLTRFELVKCEQGSMSTRHAETVSSDVWFRQLSSDDIEGYIRTGEGLDKAAGYAIQGLGACLVEKIHGSYPAIVGLPITQVVQAMKKMRLLASFPGPKG